MASRRLVILSTLSVAAFRQLSLAKAAGLGSPATAGLGGGAHGSVGHQAILGSPSAPNSTDNSVPGTGTGSLNMRATPNSRVSGYQAFAGDSTATTPCLTVSGLINYHGHQTATFSIAFLEALGLTGFTTSTPWNDKAAYFQGVRLDLLMSRIGAYGTKAIAYGLDDYAVAIPLSDFRRFGTLLATRIDGHYIAIQHKGPLFVMYPFDENPNLRSELYYSRAVWQLDQLVIK